MLCQGVPWYCDSGWWGVISATVIGIVGIVIAYFQYKISKTQDQISQTQTRMLSEQIKLAGSIDTLNNIISRKLP